MIYVMVDETRIEAQHPKELVSLLRESSLSVTDSDEEFMKEMAERSLLQTGDVVRSDTADNFVADLIAVGIVKEIKKKDNGEDDE